MRFLCIVLKCDWKLVVSLYSLIVAILELGKYIYFSLDFFLVSNKFLIS